MTSRDFCYWLQGYFEIHGGDAPFTAHQTAMVKKHLSLVFIHEIDPATAKPGSPEAIQLNAAHSGQPPVTQPGVQYRC